MTGSCPADFTTGLKAGALAATLVASCRPHGLLLAVCTIRQGQIDMTQ